MKGVYEVEGVHRNEKKMTGNILPSISLLVSSSHLSLAHPLLFLLLLLLLPLLLLLFLLLLLLFPPPLLPPPPARVRRFSPGIRQHVFSTKIGGTEGGKV